MRFLRNCWLRHRLPGGLCDCLTRRRGSSVWLLFLAALTAGAWISSTSFNDIPYYVRDVEDSDMLHANDPMRNETLQNQSLKLTSTTEPSKTALEASLTSSNEPPTTTPSRPTPANPSASESFSMFSVTNFTFLHNNATACQGASMIALVHTSVVNAKRREVIRNTWGKGHPVFFMMGQHSTLNNTLVDEESARYNDIVQGSFIDTYRNLTYKHVMDLHWVHRYCPNVSIIVKVDDDVYVNLKLAREYVDQLYKVSPSLTESNCSTSLMLCDIANYLSVFRNEDSKWKVTKEEYEPDWYPPYCFGWNTIYSKKAMRCLLEHVKDVPFFWIEDVYVTGLVAEVAEVNAIQMDRKRFGPGLYSFQEKLSLSALKSFARNIIFGPYDLGSDELDYLGKLAALFNSQS